MLITWHKKSFVKFIANLQLLYGQSLVKATTLFKLCIKYKLIDHVRAQKQPPNPLRIVVLRISSLTQLIYKSMGLLDQL